jgi:hypothetical protein
MKIPENDFAHLSRMIFRAERKLPILLILSKQWEENRKLGCDKKTKKRYSFSPSSIYTFDSRLRSVTEKVLYVHIDQGRAFMLIMLAMLAQ